MSCCTNLAMACIFCSCVVFPAVKPVTCCLIASDASICPLTRFPYQLPISAQFANSFFLEIPDDLQKKGLLLYFIFVANDVSRVGRRDAQLSVPDVRDQFASFERRGKIERVLLLDRIVLALRRDAPAMQTSDFSARIEIDAYRAMFSPFGPQNLVGLAHLRPDLIHRQNGHVPLGIQQHRVGLLIVRRQRGPDQCAHPLWSLTGHGPRLSGHKRYSDPKENLPPSPASY